MGLLIRLDSSGRVRSLSGSRELLGQLGGDELIGMSLLRVLPPQGRETLRHLLREVLLLGMPLQAELELQGGAAAQPVLLAPVPTGGIDELLLICPWRGGSARRLSPDSAAPADQRWVVDEAPIGTILIDDTGAIVQANAIAKLLLELDEGLEGLQLEEVPPLQRAGLAAELREVLGTGRNLSRPLARGEVGAPAVWCSTALRTDEGGRIVALALYLVDQLPLAMIEADLDRNRQLLDLLVEENAEAIVVVDRLGRVLRANGAAVRLLALPNEMLVHHPIQELLRDPLGEGVALWRLLGLATDERLELRIPHVDGTSTPAQVRCRTISRDQHQLVLTDQSAQQRLHDVRQAADGVLRALLESAPSALALVGADGKVRDANAAMLTLLGMAPSVVVGATLSAVATQLPLAPGRDPQSLHTHLTALLSPGGPRVVRVPLRPPAPGHSAELQLIRLDGPLPEQPLVLLALDISGAGSWGEGEALMPSLALLIDESLRYLNDPLLKMVLLSENSREGSPRLLEGLEGQYQLAHSLLVRLRRLCGALHKQPQLSDARVAVREGVAAATAGWTQSDPVVVVPPRPVPVRAEASQLSLIVEELVRNGLEATGGLEGEVTVLLRIADDHAELLVRDLGAGIDPTQVPTLTTPFHSMRLDRDTQVRGLGLCSAAVMAHRLGAQLRLLPSQADSPDVGTQWQLRVPLSPLRESIEGASERGP